MKGLKFLRFSQESARPEAGCHSWGQGSWAGQGGRSGKVTVPPQCPMPGRQYSPFPPIQTSQGEKRLAQHRVTGVAWPLMLRIWPAQKKREQGWLRSGTAGGGSCCPKSSCLTHCPKDGTVTCSVVDRDILHLHLNQGTTTRFHRMLNSPLMSPGMAEDHCRGPVLDE